MKNQKIRGAVTLFAVAAFALATKSPVNAQETSDVSTRIARELPTLPQNLPSWLFNTDTNHIARKRGVYNDAIYKIPNLARDMNGVAVGHAMAYEDLVTGKADRLETETFGRIMRILNAPPRFMPDEAALSPTFGRKYGVLEQVFDWTHVLHAQTLDVLASTQMSSQEKEREIEALWNFYFTKVPYAVSPLPMNMAWLDAQPYSGAFRQKYPKVNGLFWGYHWLQGVAYDALYDTPLVSQKKSYEILRERYFDAELKNIKRPFMPMFAEVSPRFALKFPHIANAFDNLHMLHDLVNDILASEWIGESQKEQQILRAVWMMSAQAHAGEKPGEYSKENPLHDHRFMDGMPAMGLMPGASQEVMNMPGMGWMSFADCHHCSMPMPRGENAWQAHSVAAQGWTMRVRCALCARDMALETKGKSILRLATEKPNKIVTVWGDEQGNLSTDTPGAIFIEEPSTHARCNAWSRAFSGRKAFDEYVKANPRYADAKPISFEKWSQLQGEEPDTYVRPQAPKHPIKFSAACCPQSEGGA
jgi:hypothetical protein